VSGDEGRLFTVLAIPTETCRRDEQRARAEKDFVFAILTGAIRDSRLPLEGRLRTEARAWIERDGVGYLTFVECCEWLDLDPEEVREEALSDRPLRLALRGRYRGDNVV